MSNIIVYEQPLNERIRNFMRLEYLFNHAAYTMRGYSVWDSRATMTNLINIIEILSRSDYKTELIKELEYLLSEFTALRSNPDVDTKQLDTVLQQLTKARTQLHSHEGALVQSLRENELIAALLQRNNTVAGNCKFDLPVYHFWLQQEPEVRIQAIEKWFEILGIVDHPVTLILNIIRESTVPIEMFAESGFFQQNLDQNKPAKIIRVSIEKQAPYFAEISGGKHRFTVRFLEPRDTGRPMQSNDNVKFLLNCCTL